MPSGDTGKELIGPRNPAWYALLVIPQSAALLVDAGTQAIRLVVPAGGVLLNAAQGVFLLLNALIKLGFAPTEKAPFRGIACCIAGGQGQHAGCEINDADLFHNKGVGGIVGLDFFQQRVYFLFGGFHLFPC